MLAQSTGGKAQVVAFASRTLTKAEGRFTVEHRPGNKHSNADVLSHIPCEQCGWQEELEEPPAKAVVMATEILPQNNSHEFWGWTPACSPEELCTLQPADPGLYTLLSSG